MEICVFSKHLQEFGFGELGSRLAAAGFTGVDLTVRKGGHVEPAEVAHRLPEAVDLLGAEGVKVSMITTFILSLDEEHARETLRTAADLGIGFYKFGYYLYDGSGDIDATLADARAKLADLAAFSKDLGIWGGYHNHSGWEYIGASLPHVAHVLADADAEGAGAYFDVGHAFGEGAKGSWKQGFDQLAGRIRMAALKELAFGLSPEGNPWTTLPMGEGAVPWDEVAARLRRIEPQLCPLSIHAEYDLPGAEVLERARRDREFFEGVWAEAARDA